MRGYSGRDKSSPSFQRLKLPNHLDAQEKEILNSKELLTPFRLFIMFVLSVTMVLSLLVSLNTVEVWYERPPSKGNINISKDPYVFDFPCMKETREEMLRSYGYSDYGQWIVDKRSGLSLEEFWDIYDGKWPVIITDVVPKWPAINWTKDLFLKNYGNDRVIIKVVAGKLESAVSFTDPMRVFIEYLDQYDAVSWTYMEDEMFLLTRTELKQQLGPNPYLEGNFFELFPEEVKPWDAMMLWGTKYSRSSLHMDPYNWTAVSAVLWGTKKWKLFPPGQDQDLYINKNQCGFPLECVKYDSPIDAFEPDYWSYPKFRKTEYLEVEQTAGEMLIIPTGWYHQAYNEEETLSISTQLMSRNNYLVVLEELIKAKNISRKKLPANFNTLLPPDQVKLFMSLLPKRVLKNGKELTDNIHKMASKLRADTNWTAEEATE